MIKIATLFLVGIDLMLSTFVCFYCSVCKHAMSTQIVRV